MQTPWGESQSITEVAEGVQFVKTSSHGGYKLSTERLQQMPDCLKATTAFYKGDGWFEEDCEWARVALAFPSLFPPKAIPAAEATMRSVYPQILQEFKREVKQ